MIRITDFVPGDRVRLVGFGQAAGSYRQRLLALGLTCGLELSVIRVAPMGCPVQLDVRGTSVALRKTEALSLLWERVVCV